MPTDSETLAVLFIGYTSQELAAGSQATLTVRLAADAKSLDEVVVTALGIGKSDRKLDYSVTTVRPEESEGGILSSAGW